MHREPQRGSALINVLAVTGLASAVVAAMLSQQDRALSRSEIFADAAQAAETAHAGVTSAIVALRRDMATAPRSDHPAEPWSVVTQQKIRIDGGSFALSITDAQSRFNLNNLAGAGATSTAIFRRIAAALQLKPAEAALIEGVLRAVGPIRELRVLARHGVPGDLVAKLSQLTTVLPDRSSVNINTADPVLVSLLFNNPGRTLALMARRERAGFVTEQDLQATQLLMPPGMGFTSDHYIVDVRVRVGQVQRRLETHLHRQKAKSGRPNRVVRLSQKWKAAAP